MGSRQHISKRATTTLKPQYAESLWMYLVFIIVWGAEKFGSANVTLLVGWYCIRITNRVIVWIRFGLQLCVILGINLGRLLQFQHYAFILRCTTVCSPYKELFILLCICAHGHIRLVCVALCLSGQEQSFVYLQYVDVFLHCYHFLLSSWRETERGHRGGENRGEDGERWWVLGASWADLNRHGTKGPWKGKYEEGEVCKI